MPKLLHVSKSKPVYEPPDMLWDDDRLIASHGTQSLAVQMIKVRMRDQYEINRREVTDFHARMLDAFDHLQPLRPIRIDKNAVFRSLNEERRVADPSDADVAFL